MTFIAQGRWSDCPYVESVWRGQSDVDIAMMCPADWRWNLCVTRLNGKVWATVEGPQTKAVPKTHFECIEWLVIKFDIGTYLPSIPTRTLLNSDATLPEASSKTFWLSGASWELPNFENADTFVNRLMRDGVVVRDPVISAALQDQPVDVPKRTLRHRFQQIMGLPQGYVRQIERAQQATALLEQGQPILDVVHQIGYADQPHMTRSLKHFAGRTPAQIASMLGMVL